MKATSKCPNPDPNTNPKQEPVKATSKCSVTTTCNCAEIRVSINIRVDAGAVATSNYLCLEITNLNVHRACGKRVRVREEVVTTEVMIKVIDFMS